MVEWLTVNQLVVGSSPTLTVGGDIYVTLVKKCMEVRVWGVEL